MPLELLEAHGQPVPVGLPSDESDPANPVLVVDGRRRDARLPINKDLLIINGSEIRLGSIVVHAPLRDAGGAIAEDRVYIPDGAIEIPGRVRSVSGSAHH